MNSQNEEIADLRIRVERLEKIVEQLSGQPLTQVAAGMPSEAWEAEVRALIAQGNELQAIKVLRLHTNSSLAEAHMRVQQMKG